MAQVQDAVVDATLKRLEGNKAVVGVLILTHEGKVIRSTLPESAKTMYSTLLTGLVQSARETVHSLDDKDDLVFCRIRTKKHEIMLAPERDFLLVVIQNPNVSHTTGATAAS